MNKKEEIIRNLKKDFPNGIPFSVKMAIDDAVNFGRAEGCICGEENIKSFNEGVAKGRKEAISKFAEELIKKIEDARDRLGRLEQLSYHELYNVIKSKSEMR